MARITVLMGSYEVRAFRARRASAHRHVQCPPGERAKDRMVGSKGREACGDSASGSKQSRGGNPSQGGLPILRVHPEEDDAARTLLAQRGDDHHFVQWGKVRVRS
jgi:hypothetical protein